jgi:PhnB protein
MTAPVKPIPADMHTITPHLVCENALEAIEFYKRAFGATDAATMLTPDGKLMHGQVRIGDSALMLMEENKEWNAIGPKHLQASPVTIHLYVTDVDAVYARAVKEGATAKMEPADMFWGDRYGVLTDPFGHSWSIATHKRDLTPEQMAAGMKEMCGDSSAQKQ